MRDGKERKSPSFRRKSARVILQCIIGQCSATTAARCRKSPLFSVNLEERRRRRGGFVFRRAVMRCSSARADVRFPRRRRYGRWSRGSADCSGSSLMFFSHRFFFVAFFFSLTVGILGGFSRVWTPTVCIYIYVCVGLCLSATRLETR